MTAQLLIFAKHPDPGRCKTRLIPALGEQGAADLHAALTRHTLSQAAQLSAEVCVELLYTGGDPRWFQELCTEQEVSAQLQPQAEGDLGARLRDGFERAFARGMQYVAAIGTDCPELSAELMTRAFLQLQTNDSVLGPAADGGYYLLGTAAPAAELFEGISWGSSLVLAQTRAVLTRCSMSVALLPELRDIDRPEDLEVCRRLGLPVPG